MATGTAMRSGNPALGEKAVDRYLVADAGAAKTMTVAGTALKTLLLACLLVAAGAYGWASATKPVSTVIGSGTGNTTVTIPGGFWLVMILALFLGILTSLNPRRAPVLGPLYALCEGYLLGAISAAYNAETHGIVAAAILGTLFVFVVSLLCYVTGIVKPTRRLAFGVTVALGGLLLMYLFVGLLSVFDWSFLYSDQFRAAGIAINLAVVVLAALALTLDFGTVEAGVEARAPRAMEWYCAFGLIVTLVWLYVTILRVLALVNR